MKVLKVLSVRLTGQLDKDLVEVGSWTEKPEHEAISSAFKTFVGVHVEEGLIDAASKLLAHTALNLFVMNGSPDRTTCEVRDKEFELILS
jgi:hypothetical protein